MPINHSPPPIIAYVDAPKSLDQTLAEITIRPQPEITTPIESPSVTCLQLLLVDAHRKFIDMLTVYRDDGFDLYPQPAIAFAFMDGDSASMTGHITRNNKIKQYGAVDGAFDFDYFNAQFRFIDRELRPDSLEVPIFLAASTKATDDVAAHYIVMDAILGEVVCDLPSTVFPKNWGTLAALDSIYGAQEARLEATREVLNKWAIDNRGRHMAVLSTLADGTNHQCAPVIRPFTEATIPFSTEVKLNTIISRYSGSISILGVGGDAPFDDSPQKLKIDQALLGRMRGRPIMVDGFVTEVSVDLKIPRQLAESCGLSTLGENPIYEAKDRFGNDLNISWSYASPEIIGLTVTIAPPYTLSKETRATKQEFGVDLSKLGLGTLDGFVFQRGPSFVNTIHDYEVYCTAGTSAPSDPELSTIVAASRGVTHLFGPLGEYSVSKLLIVPMTEPNAMVYQKLPECLIFSAQVLAESTDRTLEIVARHETNHALDIGLGGLSDGAWAAWFDTLKTQNPDFFNEIKEDAFFSLPTQAGHPSDNAMEFFASFMNAIESDRWDQKVACTSESFLPLYQKSLEIVRQRICESHVVFPNSAIFELLDRRERALQVAAQSEK